MSGLAIVRQGVEALGARAATVYALTRGRRERRARRERGVRRRGGRRRGERSRSTRRAPVTDAIRSREVDRLRLARGDRGALSVVRPHRGVVRRGTADRRRPRDRRRLHRLARHEAARRPIWASSSSLARQAAQALDRAQLFEREQASADRLRKLQAVTAALSQAVTHRRRQPHLPRACGGRDRRAEGLVVLAAATGIERHRVVVAAIGLDGDRRTRSRRTLRRRSPRA